MFREVAPSDCPVSLRDGVTVLHGMVEAHAQVADRHQVVEDRRTLYRLAVALTGADGDGPPPDHVLDDPAFRHAVGEVLAGRRPGADLRVPPSRRPGPAGAPAVVGDAGRLRDVTPALDAVADECGTTPRLILDGDPRFGSALDEVSAGLDHARALVPALAADLAEHVALIGILDPEHSGAVVSASSRSMPGVVLLRPGRPIEVAESLVHEAAHQRLFDMALTRDMLRADADGQPGFRPSWRRAVWPREQALAAFHAYACLAELWRAVGSTERPPVLAAHSVLPAAAARARALGEWLFARSDLLGADACRLVCALLGRPQPFGPEPVHGPIGRTYRAGEATVVPTDEGRCLVGVTGDPPQLFWLDRDATRVLEILQGAGELAAEEILQRFTHRRGPGPFPPVWNALEKLVLSDLAAIV